MGLRRFIRKSDYDGEKIRVVEFTFGFIFDVWQVFAGHGVG